MLVCIDINKAKERTIKMTSLNNEGRFVLAIRSLSQNIYQRILPLMPKFCDTAQEIRLRVNRPVAIVCPDTTYFLTEKGGLTNAILDGAMLTVSRGDLTDTFHNICNYSVYSKQSEIVNGFVTMHGGHRAGICGTAICEGDRIINIRDISSINIRIAREHKECSRKIIDALNPDFGGVLICGAPCSGKTTLLRDMARILSTECGKRISLIDERGELAGTSSGIIQNDIGLCDVFDLYDKPSGIMQAIRSMSPDIIVCDEIGTQRDIDAMEYSVNSGVSFISTLHCSSIEEFRKKANIKKLISSGGFKTLVFLDNRTAVGRVIKIIKVGDVFVD